MLRAIKNSRFMEWCPEGDPPGAGGGGGSTTPPATFTLPEKWQDNLPEDLKNEPSLKLYNDFPSLLKSFVHAQKQMGADKVVIPSKHATPEEIVAFLKKAPGLPADAKDYKIELDKGMEVDGTLLAELQKVAAEEAIHPNQAKKFLGTALNWLKTKQEEAATTQKTALETQTNELKKEWGTAYETKVQAAFIAFKKFGDQKAEEWLDKSGFGNNPNALRMFAKVAETLTEAELKGSRERNPGALAPEDAQAQANAMIMDSKHPLNIANHPNHKAAVQEYTDLSKMAWPDPAPEQNKF